MGLKLNLDAQRKSLYLGTLLIVKDDPRISQRKIESHLKEFKYKVKKKKGKKYLVEQAMFEGAVGGDKHVDSVLCDMY